MIGIEDFGIADVGEALASFGFDQRASQQDVRQAAPGGPRGRVAGRASLSRLPWWGRAGSDEDQEIALRKGVAYVDYLGRSTAPERPRFATDVFLQRACEILGVGLEVLAGRRRTSVERDLRELVSVVGVERYGQRNRDLAAALAKDPGAVSRWVSAGAARRAAEPAFAKRVLELDQGLQASTSGELE